jgi:murein DD-endopeptidase MepM/ murein hydrolase activator NlpD
MHSFPNTGIASRMKETGSVNDRIFEKVEIEPAFPGGEHAWLSYLQKNLNANTPVDNFAPAGSYTVWVEFLVSKNGDISDIKTLTNHGFGMEAEVAKLMKNGPNWLPGIQNGIKVNAYKKQPVTFVVMEEKAAKSTSSAIELPVENGRIKYYYGKQEERRNLTGNTVTFNNPGITIESKEGSRIKTIQDGEVIAIFNLGHSKAVVIGNGDVFTTYSGMSNINVRKNQLVKKNQTIGILGINENGNPELDFIIQHGIKNIDPIAWIKNNQL